MHKMHSSLFLKSALRPAGCKTETSDVIQWLAQRNQEVHVSLKRCPIREIPGWTYGDGRISHQSGKFFSIDGIQVQTTWGSKDSWMQPIINQPEIGYLGIITKEFEGVLHFLLQAKIEPGNVNNVQLSPTLQATRSNYSRVHKGKEPLYLNYFRDAKPSQILLDQLQSEQGARFLRKRNRNIILKIDEDIPVYDDFIWLTLAQIKHLLRVNNLVNMDTRTVISGITFGDYPEAVVDMFDFLAYDTPVASPQKAMLKSALTDTGSLNTVEDIITFLTKIKSEHDLFVERVPLDQIQDWRMDEMSLHHLEEKYFRVIGVNVEIGNREVQSWSQPMIEPAQEGLCAFICRDIGGVLHFAVQAKLECGNHDIIELAPTVQCLTGNYRDAKASRLPFLEDVLNAPQNTILFDTLQSEEGGRFYREQNRNLLVMASDDFPLELPPHYIWMTLKQIQTFLKFNNYLNIQARSLVSAISFV